MTKNKKEYPICDLETCKQEIYSGWLSEKDGKKYHHFCFFKVYPPKHYREFASEKRKKHTGKITDFF